MIDMYINIQTNTYERVMIFLSENKQIYMVTRRKFIVLPFAIKENL